MHRFRPRLTYANVMSSIAVFIALGGGAYAAVSSIPGPDGVIHGCYQKQKGNLRLVSAGQRCSKSEKAIAFNQQGRPGNQGIPGTQGVPGTQGIPGAKGEQGPQGPGATTFTTTLAKGSGAATIATLTNGLLVDGECASTSVLLRLKTADGSSHLQASGTENLEGTLIALDFNNNLGAAGTFSGGELDLDLIARDSAVGKFARVDIHASFGSPCTYWGMIIASG